MAYTNKYTVTVEDSNGNSYVIGSDLASDPQLEDIGLALTGQSLPGTDTGDLTIFDGHGYTSWTVATTSSSGASRNYNLDIHNVPVESDVNVQVRTSTSAGNSRANTISTTTTGTHQPPTNFDFGIFDNNLAVQAWLSNFDGYTEPIYVQGKSRAKAIIPVDTAGTASDGASIVNYLVSIPSENVSQTLPYTYGVDAVALFDDGVPARRPNSFPSNLLTITGKVTDSLDTYTIVSKSARTLSWQAPTITGLAERIDNKGNARITFDGTFARLQDDNLNNGDDVNEILIEYKLVKFNGEVITNWTEVTTYETTINTETPFIRDYTGQAVIGGLSQNEDCTIYLKISDHFEECEYEIDMPIWEEARALHPADYEIELWDWKTGTFVADISYLVMGSLNIEWTLNDVEEVSFDIDLLRYEEKCREMGVDPRELLKPYKQDIRIRRNGEYILGCQLVQADVSLPNQPPAKIQVKGTGFLNLLKDQYIIQEAWSGYTYGEIARKLIQRAQQPDCLIKNPTGDIDTSYWLGVNGVVASSPAAHSGSRCMLGTRSGTGWITMATQMSTDTGQDIFVDVWVKAKSGDYCQIVERQYTTQSFNQVGLCDWTANGAWQHIQVHYTTFWQNGYLLIETNRTDSSTPLYVDDCYVYSRDEDAILCDLKIPLGVDTASAYQTNDRVVNYELQNIKDALTALTGLEDDNFDFDFNYDRTFNVYQEKGEEKLDLELLYPGNIESMTIGRSAANLANKIYQIGSGIGDERMQVEMSNSPSRQVYGTRESVISTSNVELEGTLRAQAVGVLYDKKDPTNLPQIVVKDGSVNPSNVQVGDYVPVQAQFDNYLEDINGIYRVYQIKLTVDETAGEQMSLTVEPLPKRPEKKMVRYIRDSTIGNTSSNHNSWNQIEALMLSGNDFVNVALNKPVYGNGPFADGCPASRATNGNINDDAKINGDGTRKAITIDLGDEYPIDYIKIWHWFADNRTYHGEHLSVGTTLPDGLNGSQDLETVLWSYGDSAGYVETSSGRRSKWLQEGDVTGGGGAHMVRYLRETHVRNSTSSTSLFTEFDTWMKTNSRPSHQIQVNHLARIYPSKTVTYGHLGWVQDGDLNSSNYLAMKKSSNRREGVTLDLGGLYPINTVKMFHFLGDTRDFYGSHLTAGKTLPDGPTGTQDLEDVIWSDGDGDGVTDTSTGRMSASIQNLSPNVKPIGRKVRYIKDTFLRTSAGDKKDWHEIRAYQIDKNTGELVDLALGIVPTATSPNQVDKPKATDGDTNTWSYTNDSGYQSLTIDLGGEYEIDYIKVKHDGQGKTTYGDRLSFGTELTSGNEPLEHIVWDDGETIGFVEPDRGRWSGWIQGEIVNDKSSPQRRPIRYIRDYIDGNSVNNSNHWVGIQAVVWENGHYVDVARGKTVTPSKTATGAHNDPQVVTNGNYDTENYFGLGNPGSAITVDLGQEYYVDFVRVYHYFGDNRTYNHAKLSVGTSLPSSKTAPLEYVLWDSDEEPIYEEVNTGKLSKWIQGEEL